MSCQKEGDMGQRLEDTVREAQDTSRGTTEQLFKGLPQHPSERLLKNNHYSIVQV